MTGRIHPLKHTSSLIFEQAINCFRPSSTHDFHNEPSEGSNQEWERVIEISWETDVKTEEKTAVSMALDTDGASPPRTNIKSDAYYNAPVMILQQSKRDKHPISRGFPGPS